MCAPTRAARSAFCAGDAALPDLVEALRSKDNTVMYESLAAMQKIRDPQAGPKITYLLRDLDDRVQTTAIETAGRPAQHRCAARAARNRGQPSQQQGGALGAGVDRDDARSERPRPVAAGTGREGRETAGGSGRRAGAHRKSGGRTRARQSLARRREDDPAPGRGLCGGDGRQTRTFRRRGLSAI